jgi:diguanylate cyclase (GGDEF)-like protein
MCCRTRFLALLPDTGAGAGMPRSRPPISISLVAVFALVIGLVCTAVLFVSIRRLEQDKVELGFRQRANMRVLTVRQQLEQTVQVLKVLNQTFASFGTVSREQFHTFTQPLLQQHSYVQAFNFHRIVSGEERTAYETRMRERYPDFVLTQLRDGKPVPATPGERYLVVDYLEPLGGNEAALGLDVSINRHLSDIVQRATDSGEAVSTELLTLAQGGGKIRGFLMVMPVYKHGAVLDSVAARRAAMIGDTAAVFDANRLMETILHENGMLDDAAISIRVYAGTGTEESKLVFRKGQEAAESLYPSLLPEWIFHDHPQRILQEFDVAGRPWTMAISAPPVAFAVRHNASLAALVSGTLISFLLAALVQMFASRSRRVHKLVEQRTAELEFQANRDSLTGLANRNLLQDRLHQASAYAGRYANPFWVLFVDLDRFKFVNDTLGHRAGDQLLRVVARRLLHSVHETDTVARLSADEFVLVLPEHLEEPLAPAAIRRIMEAIAQPIVIDGHEFVMGSSIGVAVYPSDGGDADSLIKHAGIAMYRAKEVGRNNFQFYTPAMNEHAMERLRMEGDLRNALEREEFVLHYQPQVDLGTGKVIGVEALLRWHHPELGMVPPGRFIELAEEMGLIVPMGIWVLRTACRQSVEWQRAGLAPLRVAINLSARQFYQHDLVASIRSILDETGLPPHLLELELTESMMMNDVEHAVAILNKLKAIGVHLSIDDFGTGYSSLAYLKRFPIDLLKIDQSFVHDITVDSDDAAIVLSIISLAHSLRLKVIAEGVETAAQLAYLRQHGCDYMQGYYFSRALPGHECGRLLDGGAPLPMPEAAVQAAG